MTDPAAQRARDGELYQRHRPAVFDLLVRRLHNVEEAEALAQEAMLRALDASHRQEIRSFTAFVLRIAHNLATDLLRRRRFEGGPVDAETTLAVPAEPERVELFRLEGAVRSLPESHQQLIELRYHRGLSFAEIAEELQMSKNGVFARHERALDQLRQIFARRRT
ncbi:MAG TPA: sigma-70 family RNA polymerase sigma factor [Deltaproteobacteria bacterium]|nr:sigma-70 family RNA polymerase sigma factor [Deltaproteobacteria bacterium]